MPPKDKPRPKPDDVARVSEWIDGPARARPRRRGSRAAGERVAFRRLSREEYANTDPRPARRHLRRDRPDRPAGRPGLARLPAHRLRAHALARARREVPGGGRDGLERGAAAGAARPATADHALGRRSTCAARSSKKEYQARGIADKVRVDLVPNNGALDDHEPSTIKTAGEYLRPRQAQRPAARRRPGAAAAALRQRHQPAAVRARTSRRRRIEPATIEFRTHLPAGNHPIRIVNAVPGPNPEARRSRSSGTPNAFTGLRSRVPWQMKFTDDDGKPIVPFLLLDSSSGTARSLESWPTPALPAASSSAARRPRRTRRMRDEILARFAERAWRRPVRAGGGRPARRALRESAEARRRLRGVGQDGAARGPLLEELPLPRRRQRREPRRRG